MLGLPSEKQPITSATGVLAKKKMTNWKLQQSKYMMDYVSKGTQCGSSHLVFMSADLSVS